MDATRGAKASLSTRASTPPQPQHVIPQPYGSQALDLALQLSQDAFEFESAADFRYGAIWMRVSALTGVLNEPQPGLFDRLQSMPRENLRALQDYCGSSLQWAFGASAEATARRVEVARLLSFPPTLTPAAIAARSEGERIQALMAGCDVILASRRLSAQQAGVARVPEIPLAPLEGEDAQSSPPPRGQTLLARCLRVCRRPEVSP